MSEPETSPRLSTYGVKVVKLTTDFSQWSWGDEVSDMIEKIHRTSAEVIMEQIANDIMVDVFLTPDGIPTISIQFFELDIQFTRPLTEAIEEWHEDRWTIEDHRGDRDGKRFIAALEKSIAALRETLTELDEES